MTRTGLLFQSITTSQQIHPRVRLEQALRDFFFTLLFQPDSIPGNELGSFYFLIGLKNLPISERSRALENNFFSRYVLF